jgi:hypothetical protein
LTSKWTIVVLAWSLVPSAKSQGPLVPEEGVALAKFFVELLSPAAAEKIKALLESKSKGEIVAAKLRTISLEITTLGQTREIYVHNLMVYLSFLRHARKEQTELSELAKAFKKPSQEQLSAESSAKEMARQLLKLQRDIDGLSASTQIFPPNIAKPVWEYVNGGPNLTIIRRMPWLSTLSDDQLKDIERQLQRANEQYVKAMESLQIFIAEKIDLKDIVK